MTSSERPSQVSDLMSPRAGVVRDHWRAPSHEQVAVAPKPIGLIGVDQ